jgi:osmoprotectant transport system permease protein
LSTVSLVSVGALLGVLNLGYLFTDGLNRAYTEEVAVGIVMIMIVALVFDLVLVVLGRLVLPWTRRDRRARRLGSAEAMKAVTGA